MNKETIKVKGTEVRVCKEHPKYGVSICGRVFRLDSSKELIRYLSGIPEYWYVYCSNGVKGHHVRLHRLVAIAWVSNSAPERYNVVNHINGDKLDLTPSNLEWVTAAINQRHSCLILGNTVGESNYNTQLTDASVHSICNKLSEGYRVVDLSDEYKVSKDIIRKIKAGDTWFHVRKLYSIPHAYKTDFSCSTVHWVCDQINKGVGDKVVAKSSTNNLLTPIDVKRIRHKIRYSQISDMYF